MADGSRHKARQAAVQALYQWDLTEQDPDDIEEHFIHTHDLAGADKAYLHLLVSQVPIYRQEVEDRLKPYLDRDMEAIDPVERAILRLGAYELEYQHDVPTRVILNESIELAKVFGAEHSYKFVNGVLDKLSVSLRGESRVKPAA
jgi:N utilization substance protein B